MTERLPCPHCTRTFVDGDALWQHCLRKHPRATKPPRPDSWCRNRRRRARPAEEPEPSFADLAVQAEIDRAMGIYNVDQEWLLHD